MDEKVSLQLAMKLAESVCKKLNIPVRNYQSLIIGDWLDKEYVEQIEE